MVFVGHYLGIYKYSQSFCPSIHIIDVVNGSVFSFLIDEGFWVHLFFVISGYIAAKQNISDISKLWSNVIKRFFRLAIPVFFSCLIIFLIYISIGFHNQDTSCLFVCTWYQQLFYNTDISIIDVLLSPYKVIILGDNTINGPYWVLPMMFISSSIIYLINYSSIKFKSSHLEKIIILLEIIIIIAFAYVFPIMSAHMIGKLASDYESSFDQNILFCSISLVGIAIASLFLPARINESLCFAIIILLIPHINLINSFLSGITFQFFGNISWGIYSFHWPIIYSVGALSILYFSRDNNLITAYVVSFLIVSLTTICFSIIFNISFEKLSSSITQTIYQFCLKNFKTNKK